MSKKHQYEKDNINDFMNYLNERDFQIVKTINSKSYSRTDYKGDGERTIINFHLEMKLPGNGGGQFTGWMDCAGASNPGSYGDGAGCYTGALNTDIAGLFSSTGNTFSFNGEPNGLANAKHIVFKISTHEGWTGNISNITVTNLT